jgi:hypothetical protein
MKTIEIKDATGPELDWLVAQCVGPMTNGYGEVLARQPAYSTDPTYSHRLIEERIRTLIKRDGVWSAECYSTGPGWFCFCLKGPTALIASMRAIVTAHKGGSTAQVPKELT